MIGNKARLAVNGVYQDDGSKYEPVSKIPAKNGGLAVGSLVCGIIGIVSFWSVAPSLIISIVGIILGIVNIAKKNPQKGMAIGGIITSVLGLLLSIAMIIILIAAATLVDSGYAM